MPCFAVLQAGLAIVQADESPSFGLQAIQAQAARMQAVQVLEASRRGFSDCERGDYGSKQLRHLVSDLWCIE